MAISGKNLLHLFLIYLEGSISEEMKFRSLITKTELVLDDVKRFNLKVYTSLVSSIRGNKKDSFAVGQQQTFPSCFLHSFFFTGSARSPDGIHLQPFRSKFKFDMKFHDEISRKLLAQERASLHVNVSTEFPRAMNSYSLVSFHIPFISFFLPFFLFFTRTFANRLKRSCQLARNQWLSFHGRYEISSER